MAIVDTTFLIDWMKESRRQRSGKVSAKSKELLERGEVLRVTVFTVGELYVGVAKGGRPVVEETAIIAALENFEIVGFDEVTAKIFGLMLGKLEMQGQAIADMDKKLKAVELKLITESDMMSDDKYYPEQYQLYMNLIWLGGEVGNGAGDVAGNGDYGPTETQTALVLDLERQLEAVKVQYKGVMDKDVPAFNQTVGPSGIAPLKTTGAPPAPVRAGRGGGN